MKKIGLLLIPALMLAAPAFAQTEAGLSMITVGAGAGYALPMGDFADDFDGGLTVGLNACYMITDMYGIEAGVDWAKFPANEDLVGDFDVNWQFIPVTLDFMAKFPAGNFSPYVKGGVGYYFGSFTGDDVPDNTDTHNNLGFNVGGGVKIPFGETTFFDLGLTYHYIMSEEEAQAGETVLESGLPYNSSYLALKAGIAMKF